MIVTSGCGVEVEVIRFRERVSNAGGFTALVNDDYLDELAAQGNVAWVDNRQKLRIPLHHAATPDEALRLIAEYSSLAEEVKWSCLFRGQVRDYFDRSTGRLLVTPMILRPRWLGAYYVATSRWSDEVRPWFQVLHDLGIDTGSGIGVGSDLLRDSGFDLPQGLSVSHPTAVARANPVVAGVLQHYGFPTGNLDVTSDATVALWFALHTAVKARDGRIAFRPRRSAGSPRGSPPGPADLAQTPSLYIFVQPPFSAGDLREMYPIVFLNQVKRLIAVAQRPVVQEAASLPFLGIHVYPASPYARMPVFGDTIRSRWPAAVVKLHFPFRDLGRADMTAQAIFPSDEPLYRRLCAANVPHLARYRD